MEIIMNKIKLACLASILIAGAASAAPSCEGFQIRIKNNLADNLLVTKINLNGAHIQPGNFEKIDSKTEQVFSISDSAENVPMTGEFILHTVSLPSKEVVIRYTLENKTLNCEHSDKSPASDYSVDKTRKVGEVQYSITNK
jgi:hypothetical protein